MQSHWNSVLPQRAASKGRDSVFSRRESVWPCWRSAEAAASPRRQSLWTVHLRSFWSSRALRFVWTCCRWCSVSMEFFSVGLGTHSLPWISVISPFCFFIIINWETNWSMEKCMTCWLFMSWQKKKSLFLCLDPFFSYHIKEKRDYISLESGKTDVFAAVYYCGKAGFFTWRFRWILCKLVFT